MTLPVRTRSTSLARWDPWQELNDLQDQMGRLMQSVFERSDGSIAAWRPLADVTETDDSFVVEVDLPGVRREDVAVDMVGNELSVTGEIQERERAGLFRHRSRRVGRFEYRVLLPQEVDADGVTAELAGGVLTVTVPKAATAKPRRIEITAA